MRAASHHTLAVYALVGLGLQPQLPSASPHPHLFRGRGSELYEQAQERLLGAPLSLSLWVGEKLGVL